MKIGFIGLGRMGRSMAANLLRAGADLTVYDVNPAPVGELAAGGAAAAAGPGEVSGACDLVLTSLPSIAICRDVLLGEGGVIQRARPGTVIADHSTVDIATSVACADAARRNGVSFLDAPVSGGPEGAAAGTLTFMVGGDEDAYVRVEPELQKMGSTVLRVGHTGAGTTMKLINQLLVTAHSVAAAEAFNLANRAGVDTGVAAELLEVSWGASTMLRRNAPITASREFEPSGAPISNMAKDSQILMGMAAEMGLAMPVAGQAGKMLQEAVEMGLAESDVSAVIIPIEKHSRQ